MAIEPRKPPPQFVAKLQRALGGRAGWGGFVVQILFVAALAWIAYEIVANARANLQTQRITAGFGFMANTAGFDVNQNLIPYSGSDSYTRVFLVGLLNTLVVSIVGIFFATILGFLVALGRLSPNWLLARIAGGYVELIRNLPLLFQILFWYLAVLAALPNPRQSISLFGQLLSQQSRFRGSKADRQSRLRAFRFRDCNCGRRLAVAAALCPQATVRPRPADPDLALCAGHADRPAAAEFAGIRRAGQVRNSRAQGLQFRRRLARHSGIRGAGPGAGDLYRGLHRRDRARRHPVGAQGTDGGGLIARAAARFDACG